MNSLNGKNMFRKIFTKNDEMSIDKSQTFRKGISERLSSSMNGNNTLERVPGHDMLSFE